MLLHINPQCSPKCGVGWVGVGQQLSQICCWCEMQFLWRHPRNPDMQGLPWFTPAADLAQIWDAESQEGTWCSPWDTGLRQAAAEMWGLCCREALPFACWRLQSCREVLWSRAKAAFAQFQFLLARGCLGGSPCVCSSGMSCRGAAAGQEHPSHGAALGTLPWPWGSCGVLHSQGWDLVLLPGSLSKSPRDLERRRDADVVVCERNRTECSSWALIYCTYS